MSPEKGKPYPAPDESAEFIEDSIDMTGIGTIVHVRNREDTIRRQNPVFRIVRSVDFEKHIRLIISRKETAA